MDLRPLELPVIPAQDMWVATSWVYLLQQSW